MRLRLRKPEDHLPDPPKRETVTIAKVVLYDGKGNEVYVHHQHVTLLPGDTYKFQLDVTDDRPSA